MPRQRVTNPDKNPFTLGAGGSADPRMPWSERFRRRHRWHANRAV